jgi:UDP-glucose 4-epimerase
MNGGMSGPVAVTGATGFVGGHLLRLWRAEGRAVRPLLRDPAWRDRFPEARLVGDTRDPARLAEALAGCRAIVHLAGRAHTGEADATPYLRDNAELTAAYAEAARRAGIARFVFLSSIRAQTGIAAEGTLTEADPARPSDAYGRSKLAAEAALAASGLDWVALRPVLVYGAGARGNLADLLRLARLPVPLPLGAVTARRSLVSVESLIAAITLALEAPDAVGRPFVVAEEEALTIGEMIAALRAGFGRRPGLVPLPVPLLRIAAHMMGQKQRIDRLLGAQQVDAAALRALGWKPVFDARTGLARLAAERAGEGL